MENLQHLHTVYCEMKNHLSQEGNIKKITKATRQAAIDSAAKLGLTEKQHSELMCHIHLLHRIYEKDAESIIKEMAESGKK